MCTQCCQRRSPDLSIDQDRVLATILSAWDGVCVYDTDNEGLVLMVGHKGSEYHFSLVARNGERQRISDPLNQSHWLEEIVSGRLSLLWSELAYH